MQPFLLKWLTIAFAVMLASSFVAMMGAFFGSEGGDFRDLLLLQTIMIPLAIAVTLWSFGVLARQHGRKNLFRRFWQRLPGWLLFAVVLANSLVMIAELSFILIEHHTGAARPWQEHVPAATALFSSIALAACYVSYRLTGTDAPASSGGQ